jgi:FtsZ-interacting cell division protein ZipA
MQEQMKKALKIVLILLGIVAIVYIITTTWLNVRRDKRLRPALESEVAKALEDVEAVGSHEVIGKELTKVYVDIDVWNAATEGQQQQFVRNLQDAVTAAAMKAGYRMDTYSEVIVYDLSKNKIAEASVIGKVTIY